MYKYLANTLFTGKKIIYLPSCHSTNDLARQFIDKKEATDGTIVITDCQMEGKGQRGNKWLTEPGENLTFSVIYSPDFLTADENFWLTIITSLALQKALREYGVHTRIKWPNDIYAGNKKVGGILIENIIENRRLRFSVIGIGLNINQQYFQVPDAASLFNITNRSYRLQEVFEKVVTLLEQHYLQLKSGRRETLKSAYLQHLLGIDEQLEFESEGRKFTGIIRGVDHRGRLKVEVDGNSHYYELKEIKFLLY